MAKPLRALLVESAESDALLVVRELERGGFAVVFERVDTPTAMSAALDRERWDIVVAGDAGPQLSALAALALVQARRLDLPVVVVSELARLLTVVERELRAAALGAGRSPTREQSERMAAVPLANRDARRTGHATSAVSGVRRARVLVVDDEPVLATALRRMLAAEHEVAAVTCGRDALDRLANGERFDVILCDLMMPEMTGMELYEELVRRVPEQARTVLFMTGGAFTSRARDFLDAVDNPRIEKPFEIDRLKALIRRMLP